MDNVKILISFFIFILNLNLFAQNLKDHLNTIYKDNDMMGASLVVVCGNNIVESIAIGKSDYQRKIDMTEDTKYRIASISKTITTIAIMQLVEKNLLDLNDDISSILGYEITNPHHPNIAITPRMLLSHTSSITDGATYGDFLNESVFGDQIPNLKELLTSKGQFYIKGQFSNALPGKYFEYANINYGILGTIVEKLSNMRFDIYCKTYISDPLGINASFNVNHLSNIDRLAVIYRKKKGIWTSQVDNYKGEQPVFKNLDGYIPGTNGVRFGPQGGFRSSAKDLAIIFLTLINNGSYKGVKLLSQESCNTMFTNEWSYNGENGKTHEYDDENNIDNGNLFMSWGLGIHRITSTPGNDVVLKGSPSMLGHSGNAYGLVSDAFFDEIQKLGFVFMNNGVGVGYHKKDNSGFYTLEHEIFKIVENYLNKNKCFSH